MKKYLLIIIIIISITPSWALPTDSVFLQAPSKILPSINRNLRFELAEYYKSGKPDSVKNTLGTFVTLQTYDTATCHIILKTSQVSYTEIKRIKKDGSEIFVVINTIRQPFVASNISFYNTQWSEIKIILDFPKAISWLNIDALVAKGFSQSKIETMLNKNNYIISIDSNNRVGVIPNFKSMLTSEDEKGLTEFINTEIKYIQL